MLTKRGASFPWSWRRRGFHYDSPSRVLSYYEDTPLAPGTVLGLCTLRTVVRDDKFGKPHGQLVLKWHLPLVTTAPGSRLGRREASRGATHPAYEGPQESSLHFTLDSHGLLFIGECGRRLHAEADSAEEQARWLALRDEATLSRDEKVLMRDETVLLLVP